MPFTFGEPTDADREADAGYLFPLAARLAAQAEALAEREAKLAEEHDRLIRSEALERAVQLAVSSPLDDVAEVVGDALMFEAYLRGETPASVDEPEAQESVPVPYGAASGWGAASVDHDAGYLFPNDKYLITEASTSAPFEVPLGGRSYVSLSGDGDVPASE